MNVVFDFGGVLFTWSPERIVRDVFDDQETRRKALVEIFAHPDWLELDRGTLDRQAAIERGAARTGLPRSEIERLLLHVPHSLQLIPETLVLIQSLKANGSNIYALSNMHAASIEHLEREHSFWDLFDGRLISCRVRLIKPEPAIYKHLLDHYELLAEETIFIDDMDANLKAAAACGIRTIKFTNPQQCATALHEFGL